MRFGGLLFVCAVWGIPLWLVVRAWRRYLALQSARTGGLLQVRIGITLLSISATIWLLFYALVIVDEHSRLARSILSVAPTSSVLALINLPLCVASLIFCLRDGKTDHAVIPLRRAISYASGCLIVVWLFVLSAPH